MKKSLIFLAGLALLSTCLGGYTFAQFAVTDNADPVSVKVSVNASDRTLYLKPGIWNVDNPTYFAHCFGNGGSDYDVKLTVCEDPNYYTFDVSKSYTSVVFVRDPSSTSTIDWDHLWNKTADLTIDGTKDTYQITAWGGDDKISSGEWVNHTHSQKTSYSTITAQTASECAVVKETKYCGICGEILTETTFVDHEHLTEHAATAATCTEDGNDHYYSCDHCDRYFSDSNAENEITDKTSVVIGSTGHSFTNHYDSDATNHWLICDHDCGATDTLEPHTFVAGVCSVCGYVQGHVHSYVNHPAVAATCTSTGNAQYYTCSGCDHIFDSNYNEIASVPTIVALGHNYVDHECSRCHEIESGYCKVTFRATIDVHSGNSLIVVGTFNNWKTDTGYVSMSWTNGNVWVGTKILAQGSYEFKGVRVHSDSSIRWTDSNNESATFTGSSSTYSWTTWINE